MTQLEIYEGEVNLALLNDIIAFVLETAGADHGQRRLLRERCLFYDSTANGGDLQDKYGFLYLGELLERYEARFGMALRDLRAIALALGYTRDLLTDEMFVGSQREDFLRKARQRSQDDVYLTAAFYLLADEKDAVRWEQTLINKQYTKTEELLFAMSVLPDFAQAERALRPRMSVLLGAGRTMPAIGNMRLFDWLITRATPHIKTLRGKDTALLRALCVLPASYVKPGGRPYGVLEGNGYTALEIACMNTRAALTLDGGLGAESLVTEKIVVGLFRTVLSQSSPLPEEVYTALEDLFRKYRRFHIKCYGCESLADALKEDVRIQEPVTFAWFSELAEIDHPALDGFDILDPKWDSLASLLEPEKYKDLFEWSLHGDTSAEDLKAQVARYDQLTGGSYLSVCVDEKYSATFRLMVDKGLLDPWECFCASLDGEGTIIRSDTLDNIDRYLRGLQTVQAYRFYEKFFQEYGVAGLERFFGYDHRQFRESLIHNFGKYYREEKLCLKRDFLNEAAHLRMLDWLQEYYFLYEPDKYPALVVLILQDEFAAELLSREEQLALFNLIIAHKDLVRSCEQELKRRYMTEAELQAEKGAQEAARLEEERRKQMAEAQGICDELKSAEGSFTAILQVLGNYRYYRDKQRTACRIAAEMLPGILESRGYQLNGDELAPFLRICAALADTGDLSLAGVRGYISNLRECEMDDHTICKAG